MTEQLNKTTDLRERGGQNGRYGRMKVGNESNKRKEIKQTEMGGGGDENISLLAVLHSSSIISQAVLRTLCSITGNTAAFPP